MSWFLQLLLPKFWRTSYRLASEGILGGAHLRKWLNYRHVLLHAPAGDTRESGLHRGLFRHSPGAGCNVRLCARPAWSEPPFNALLARLAHRPPRGALSRLSPQHRATGPAGGRRAAVVTHTHICCRLFSQVSLKNEWNAYFAMGMWQVVLWPEVNFWNQGF